MESLRRLRFVTERYPHLQGLRLVPLGVPFLVSAAWRSGSFADVPAFLGIPPRYLFLALFATALAMSGLAGRYYRRQFGTVQPQGGVRRAAGVLVFLAAFVAAVWAQDVFALVVALPAVLVAVALAWLGFAGGHVRVHYLVLAALCLVFASLGALGVPIDTRDALLDNLIGLGLIIIGLGDHLLLRRSLEPVSRVEAV